MAGREVPDELFLDLGKVHRLTPTWPGFVSLSQVFLFGDSYSDVGWRGPSEQDPFPSAQNPLGLKWPGRVPYFDPPEPVPVTPRWPACLVRSHLADGQTLLLYDFAVSGDSVPSLLRAQRRRFQLLASEEGDVAVKPDASLCVVWIGINDVCDPTIDTSAVVAKLAPFLDDLHTSSRLRNFLLVDVPPRMRTTRPSPSFDMHHRRIDSWNAAVSNLASSFAEKHPEASVMTFSAHELFKRMLDEPRSFGFEDQDPAEYCGGIWEDGLHPTGPVHEFVARGVATFLKSVDRQT